MNALEYAAQESRRLREESERRQREFIEGIRRRDEQQARNEAMRAQQHNGHGGTVLLLVLLACILSHRLRFGLGIVVALLAVIALASWAVAVIGNVADAGNVAVILGALTIGGGLLWAIASVGAAVLRVVAVDVRADLENATGQ